MALFIISSLSSTLLDYLVYIFLLDIVKLDSINVCYTIAKVIGAAANFAFNNYIVFQKKGSAGLFRRLIAYSGVVVIVAIIGNFLIALFHINWDMHALVAKLITDTSTFFVSYFTQLFFVFKDKPEDKNNRR